MVRFSRFLAPVVLAGALAVPGAASASRFSPLHRATPHVRAAAAAAAKAKKAKLPVVTSVAPMHLKVGQTLRIRGRNFLVGHGKNTVVFQRSGGGNVFVKSGLSTSKRMWVPLPKRLQRFLTRAGSAHKPTRFRLRVLAHRFAAHFTARRLSPVVAPAPVKSHGGKKGGSGGGSGSGSGGGSGSTTSPTCDSTGKTLSPTADADKDGLNNALELKIHTDPCLADTDGDTLPDFWEYKAALDYNSDALPYPGKRPYPNALDPSDLNIDFDGDGLSAGQEERVWARWGNKDISKPLFLSDGLQSSVQVVPVTAGDAWAGLDSNRDGRLTDDERDSDLGDATGRVGDGLSNWDEANGRMTPDWWTTFHAEEKHYGPSRYAATDYMDPDTDGDGVLDGADDVDHDGYTNAQEVTRYPDGTPLHQGLWVQPFNPCLPGAYASPVHTCSLYVTADPWPPFDRDLSAFTPPYSMAALRASPGLTPKPRYDYELTDPDAPATP